MSDTNKEMVKIFFEPPGGEEDWHTTVESIWATPIDEPGAPGGRVFQLENSPWYAFGVSWEDIVCGELRHEIIGDDTTPNHPRIEVEVLYFTRVWKHSGRSTYALFLSSGITTESPEWLARWEPLKNLGCTWEGMSTRLLAVDIPPSADLTAVEKIFEEGLACSVFDYQIQHRFSSN
jgi:hypothetical protein